jgi:transcriptional regulator with XRE-family HTH domain
MTKPWKEITASRPDTPERRAAYLEGRAEAVNELVAHNLGELRKLRAVTQVELARLLGITQPTLSQTERRNDVQLSTLRDFIHALGGHLELTAVFDDLRFPLHLDPPTKAAPRLPAAPGPSLDPLHPWMSGDDADPVLVSVVLEGIADRLLKGHFDATLAGDRAAATAYRQVLHEIQPIREEWAQASGRPIALESQLMPAHTEPSVPATDLEQAVHRIYIQHRDDYDKAKFGGDPVGRRAYGQVLDAIDAVWTRSTAMAQTDRQQHPSTQTEPTWTVPPDEIVTTARRLANPIPSPKEDGLDRAEQWRRSRQLRAAAAQVAERIDYNTALAQEALRRATTEMTDADRHHWTSPLAVAVQILVQATTMKQPETNSGDDVARVADMCAQLVNNGRRIDENTERQAHHEALDVLGDYTITELQAGIDSATAIAAAHPRPQDPMAVTLLDEALRRKRPLN